MFIPQFRPVVGGAERQAEKLAAELGGRGLNVTVLTPRKDDASPEQEACDGYRVIRLPNWVRGAGRWFPGLLLVNLWWSLRQHLRTADVVHCHIGSVETIWVGLLARWWGIPSLCKAATAHDRSDLGELSRVGWLSRIVSYAGPAAFTRWVATTRAVKLALERAGVEDSRICVIPNGVAIRELREIVDVRRFLYLGRLSRNDRRDIPGLLHAFDRFADTRGDAELMLVGGGDLLDSTRDRAARCTNARRIGIVGQDDPEKWISWADVLVLPSRVEGLSNALLEAMARGIPCVAYDVPSNREVLDDGKAGVLVPVGDVDALARAMQRLAASSAEAADIGRRGWERARETYSIDQVASAHESLYRTLSSAPSKARGHSTP